MRDLSFDEAMKTVRLGDEQRDSDGLTLVDAARDTIRVPRVPRLEPLDIGQDSTAEYRVVARLGEGGMGVVELADQASLERAVALKTVRPGRGSQTRHQAALLREARVLAVLDHPNVVPVHGVGLDERGDIVVVMKRVEGETWSDLLDGRTSASDDLDEHLRILGEVCQAVAYAHSKGILHRDLKPSNVMIGEFGEVYVLDWGLALSLPEIGPDFLPGFESVEKVVGTPRYIAPEMVLGDQGVDLLGPRTDVYLLGGILHEILSQRPPHEGASTTKTLEAAFLSLRPQFGPDVPGQLASVCTRALEREPGLRFESVRELHEAVKVATRHTESEAIARRTEERRAALYARRDEPDVDEAEVFRELGAIRYGFEQALEAWPTNPTAIAGLREVLIMSVEVELARNNAVGAADLLEEIEDPPEQLVHRVARAHREKESLSTEVKALRQLRDLEDPAHGEGARRLVIFVIIVGMSAIGPVGLLLDEGAFVRAYFGHIVAFGALLVGTIFLKRDLLWAPGVNRRQSLALLAAYVLIFAIRLLAFRGVDVAALMTLELVFFATSTLTMGVTIVRRVRYAVPGYALGALVALPLPSVALPVYAIAHWAALVPVAMSRDMRPIGEVEAATHADAPDGSGASG